MRIGFCDQLIQRGLRTSCHTIKTGLLVSFVVFISEVLFVHRESELLFLRALWLLGAFCAATVECVALIVIVAERLFSCNGKKPDDGGFPAHTFVLQCSL